MKEYNTTKAADILGVTEQTILNWIKDGKLHANVYLEHYFCIPEEEIVKYVKDYAESRLEKLGYKITIEKEES